MKTFRQVCFALLLTLALIGTAVASDVNSTPTLTAPGDVNSTPTLQTAGEIGQPQADAAPDPGILELLVSLVF